MPAGLSLQCLTAGTANLYEVLYYVPQGVSAEADLADLSAEVAMAADRLADEAFSVAPAGQGTYRTIRVETDSACAPSVRTVRGKQSGADFGSVVGDLVFNLGFTRFDRKYIVFVEGSSGCGQANIQNDDVKAPSNSHNTALGFALIYEPCWSTQGRTVLHEIAHNLSAVQLSAPHNSSFGESQRWHCTDEYDRLCQSEPQPALPLLVLCSDREWFDCGHDDYFDPAPAAGSYLSTHFNMADDSWWIGAEDTIVPALDSPLVARDVSAQTAGQILPSNPVANPGGDYQVEMSVSGHDNWEVAFRFFRSDPRSANALGECPANEAAIYGESVDSLLSKPAKRMAEPLVKTGFGITAPGCYRIAVRAEDPAGRVSGSASTVVRIATLRDQATQPVKGVLGL